MREYVQDYCVFVGGPNDGERALVPKNQQVWRVPSRGDVEGYTYAVTAYNELRFREYVHGNRRDYRVFTALAQDETLQELLDGFVLSNGQALQPDHTLFVVKGDEGKTQFVSHLTCRLPPNPTDADGNVCLRATLLGLKVPSHVFLEFEQRPLSRSDGSLITAFVDVRLAPYDKFVFDHILARYKKVIPCTTSGSGF